MGLHYPDGPDYVHYANMRDIVPLLTGVLAKGSYPGKGAVIGAFYYEDHACDFGMLPLPEYPGADAELSVDLKPSAGKHVHSLCSYAASGLPYEYLREYAPGVGHIIIPLAANGIITQSRSD